MTGRGSRSAPAVLAGGIAAVVLAAGVLYGARIAGGSDSWGYLSQAELWRSGALRVDQPFVAEVPWPRAGPSFAPLGYAARGTAIVPVYAPGYPILLALAKSVGGQAAMFLVVPVCGAVLVMATFAIGRRMASPAVGLAGAWLVGTSPAVLFSVMTPMSDVPTAALWAVAFTLWLARTGWAAAGAGLCASLAVLVRPNLAVLALAFWVGSLADLWPAERRARTLGQCAWFTAGLLPGVAIVAILNQSLYGSPFTSGYGRLSQLLAMSNVVPNIGLYLGWLASSQTPLAWMGLGAALAPARTLWPNAARRDRVVMAVFVALVWGFYCLYAVFEVWWYLRFLLASWPFIALGVAVVLVRLGGTRHRRARWVGIAVLASLGLFQAWSSVERGAFRIGTGERRYFIAARMVRNTTEPNSVVLSMQHSGSIRYYASRVTLRYDELSAAVIDDAVAFLTARGAHVYLMADEWELSTIRSRFAGTRTAEALNRPPLALFPPPGPMFLFDLSTPPGDRHRPTRYADLPDSPRTPPPGLPPVLAFR